MPPALGAAGMVLLAVVVTVVLGGCGQQEASNTTPEDQGGAGHTEETTTGQTTASMGDTVSVGSVQWSATGTEQHNELPSPNGMDQGNFIIVDLTFVNHTNQDITLATPFFVLRDSQGREFEPDIDANLNDLYPEEQMFSDQIAPGSTKEGKIVFNVESDSSGFTLQVGEARFSSTKTAYIKLNI
jgi:hypothetical protein